MPWVLPVRQRSFLPHALDFFKRLSLCLRDHIVDCEHSCYADCRKHEVGVSWADAILKGGQNQTDLHIDFTAYNGQHLLVYYKPLSPFQTSIIRAQIAFTGHASGTMKGLTRKLLPKLVRVAMAVAGPRAAKGKTSPTISQLIGPKLTCE